MKNIILFIIILLTYIHPLFAQKTPEYLWGKFGGNTDVAVDMSGNIFAVGVFSDTVTINGQKYTSKGGVDILLTKLDAEGSYIWVNQYGTGSDEFARNIDIDEEGNIFITGEYDTPTMFGSDSLTGSGDIFIIKLDKNGNNLWARSFGGPDSDFGINQISIDRFGNIVLGASIFLGKGITITIGSEQFTGVNSGDIFVIKLNKSGGVIWAKREGRFPGSGTRCYGVATDNDGNIYNTGYYIDTVYFDSAMLTDTSRKSKMYLTKYDSSGKLLFVVTPVFGGLGTGLDVAVSSDNKVYVCGVFSGLTVIGSDTIDAIGGAGFLTQYNSDGTPNWLRVYPDNKNLSEAFNVAIGNDDGIYVGYAYGEATLAKYSTDGTLMWSNQYGPQQSLISVDGICSSPGGGVFITGRYSDTVFGKDTLHRSTAPPNTYYHSYIAHVGAFPANINKTPGIWNHDIALYPNPNSGNFIVRGNSLCRYKNYDVISLTGQSVASGNLLPVGNAAQISTGLLPQGIYILRLSGESSRASLTFRIE